MFAGRSAAPFGSRLMAGGTCHVINDVIEGCHVTQTIKGHLVSWQEIDVVQRAEKQHLEVNHCMPKMRKPGSGL